MVGDAHRCRVRLIVRHALRERTTIPGVASRYAPPWRLRCGLSLASCVRAEWTDGVTATIAGSACFEIACAAMKPRSKDRV